jgi:hypothetical protein
MTPRTNACEVRGLEQIPEDQWSFYKEVIEAVKGTDCHFALGGAFAWACYTGLYRNTKDLDLYVMPDEKENFIRALSSIGATDLFASQSYDRGWIYRSTRDGYIVDIIWAMANYRRPLDKDYIEAGPIMDVRGERLHVLPAEELILNKLYILQRGRCDWFDVFNLLYSTPDELDWKRLIDKLGEDAPLLAGAMKVYAWLCPGRVRQLPEFIWQALGLSRPTESGPDFVRERVLLLDSRPWFLPALAPGETIFVDGKK